MAEQTQHATAPEIQRCAFKGCTSTTMRPMAEGWSALASWDHTDFPDGLYCPQHQAVAEAGQGVPSFLVGDKNA
jgi:hypothetical protein